MKPLTYAIVFLTLDFSVLGEFFFHYMKPHLLVLDILSFHFRQTSYLPVMLLKRIQNLAMRKISTLESNQCSFTKRRLCKVYDNIARLS